MINDKTLAYLLAMQQDELDESIIYSKIARTVKDENNRSVLERISADERSHYEVWKTYTDRELKPRRLKIFLTVLTAKIFGFTFAVKRMESRENIAGPAYAQLVKEVPEAAEISEQEDEHERQLLSMLDEERLRYVGSMVLGLSDALVELTGTLAGLTFALQNTRLVALSGLITGISATLSMASSEFLSAKSEGRGDALKSCLYTGAAYVATVALLTLPYLVLPEGKYLTALVFMLAAVVLIVAAFNYYIAVAKEQKFLRRFAEMTGISLGIAALAFGVGILVKKWLGVDI
jgi:VIT1/CCC1 family predicted Fe2+/Mn2+ transporter